MVYRVFQHYNERTGLGVTVIDRGIGTETTLAEKAYHQLRGMIVRGELTGGQRLVNRTLASQLGVSFTPVREAIRQLASEGLIDYVHGDGAFVRSPSQAELEELYDLRETLEPFVAEHAARKISEEQLRELEQICAQGKELTEELDPSGSHGTLEQMQRLLDTDSKFHDILYAASCNRWVGKIAHDLRLVSHAFTALRWTPEFLTRTRAETTYQEHAELVRLLRAGDGGGAARWMTTHIRNGREQVLGFIRDAEKA